MQNKNSTSANQTLPLDLVGTFRRIGHVGPVYQILGDKAQGGKSLARILVLESGEEADYSITEILEDPIAT